MSKEQLQEQYRQKVQKAVKVAREYLDQLRASEG